MNKGSTKEMSDVCILQRQVMNKKKYNPSGLYFFL